MWVKLIPEGTPVTVNESYGMRLIEQGKAIPAEAPVVAETVEKVPEVQEEKKVSSRKAKKE